MNNRKNDESQENKEESGDPVSKNQVQIVRFEDLANGEKEIVVEYERQHYRLRVTKNGKLILNK